MAFDPGLRPHEDSLAFLLGAAKEKFFNKTNSRIRSKTFVSCSGNIIKVKKFYKLGAES